MADTEKTAASLVDQLVALDREQWCEVAEQLRGLAETVAEVPDGKRASHVLGVVAHLLDPG